MLSDNLDATLNYPGAISSLNPLMQTHSRMKEVMNVLLTLLDKVETICLLFECDGAGGERKKEEKETNSNI